MAITRGYLVTVKPKKAALEAAQEAERLSPYSTSLSPARMSTSRSRSCRNSSSVASTRCKTVVAGTSKRFQLRGQTVKPFEKAPESPPPQMAVDLARGRAGAML